jgi:hypothetical protein
MLADLAANPATPAEVRMRLADDPDRLVALRVVNEQTPLRSEHALRREVERYVRAFARGLLTWQELHGELSFDAYDDRRLMHPIAWRTPVGPGRVRRGRNRWRGPAR